MSGTAKMPPIAEIKAAPAAPNASSYDLVRASNIIIRSKQWLWPGHLLRGALELTTGVPGLGKSQVQIHIVACVTAGLPWPDGAKAMQPASVVMLTAEDALDQEVVPRLIAAGANLDRVSILKAIRKGQERQFLLGEDLRVLENIVRDVGDVALITVDPITAYMGGQMDSHKTTEVRSQLGPLKDFAERTNIAVSAITHPPKSAGHRAIDHFIGSQAFIAAGRIGHVCIEETTDEDEKTGRVLFANAKNNTHTKMPTLAYRVEAVAVGRQDDGTVITAPRVVFDSEPVDVTADEAVQRSNGSGKSDKRKRGQPDVQAFLANVLEDGDWTPAKTIITMGKQRGFTPDQLRTACIDLKVEKVQPTGMGGAWSWRLPPAQGTLPGVATSRGRL